MSCCGGKYPVCPSPVRNFSFIGAKDFGKWEHTTTQSIVLSWEDSRHEILNTDRLAGVEWNQYYKATDAYECLIEVGEQPAIEVTYHLCAETYDTEPYLCEFKEKNTQIVNEILFLDLRHNILVRKETIHEYDQIKTSSDSSAWNQYGTVLQVHKIVPGDLEITEHQKLYINNELVDTVTLDNYSENPYTITFPPMGGTPQANTQTNGIDDLYYIWTEEKDEDGGYDLYFPAWVRGMHSITGPFDLINRDRHIALYGIVPYEREPYSGPISVLTPLAVAPTRVAGSWAVSPTLDEEEQNLRAYTTLKLNNTDFINALYPEPIPDPATTNTVQETTDNLFGNPTEMPCPIAPL